MGIPVKCSSTSTEPCPLSAGYTQVEYRSESTSSTKPDNIRSVLTAVFQTEASLTHFCQRDMLENDHLSCSGGGEVPQLEHKGTAREIAALTLPVLLL